MSGSSTRTRSLKAITASDCPGLRRASKARAAAIAPASGLPFMLFDASTSSTTANSFCFAPEAEATERLSTGRPFSVTWICDVPSWRFAGSVRTYARLG